MLSILAGCSRADSGNELSEDTKEPEITNLADENEKGQADTILTLSADEEIRSISGKRSKNSLPKKEFPFIIMCENLVKIHKTKDLEVMALQGLDHPSAGKLCGQTGRNQRFRNGFFP